MECTANIGHGLGFPTCPEPIDLTSHLKSLFYTEVQIEWIITALKQVAGWRWLEVTEISEFPLNHDYGFTKDGKCKKGSKYNLKIGIKYEDRNNIWAGTQSSYILLIKDNIN